MNQFSKRLMSFSVFVLLVFSVSVGLMAEAPEILQAARKGLCDFVTAEKSEAHLSQGPSQIMAVDNGTVDQGFRVYTIAPSHLINKTGLDSMLTPTDMYRFVVLKENLPISLVTVAPIKGQWTAVSLGGAGLAKEVYQVMQTWPETKGYSYKFVRVYQSRTDFMQISRSGSPIGFVPLTSSRMVFEIPGGFDPSLLMNATDIEAPLKKLMHERLSTEHMTR